jgi:hypothetical protein
MSRDGGKNFWGPKIFLLSPKTWLKIFRVGRGFRFLGYLIFLSSPKTWLKILELGGGLDFWGL